MPRRRTAAHPIRLVVADNVKARMRYLFADEGDQYKALAKAAGTSISTVQRVTSGRHSNEIDTIARIAHGLDLAAYQLFLPNLSPSNPQAVKNATKDEQRLYDFLESLNRKREKS